MGLYGNPAKFSMVTGEREEESPWPTLASDQGLPDAQNALTLTFPTAFAWTMLPGSDADSVVEGIARGITRVGVVTVILNPQHAKTLADAGWTKDKLLDYIVAHADNARPVRRRSAATSGTTMPGAGMQRAGFQLADAGEDEAPRGAPARGLRRQELRVLVAGGSGGLAVAIASGGGGFATQRVSQPIELPRQWKELVAQYGSLRPKYQDECDGRCGF